MWQKNRRKHSTLNYLLTCVHHLSKRRQLHRYLYPSARPPPARTFPLNLSSPPLSVAASPPHPSPPTAPPSLWVLCRHGRDGGVPTELSTRNLWMMPPCWENKQGWLTVWNTCSQRCGCVASAAPGSPQRSADCSTREGLVCPRSNNTVCEQKHLFLDFTTLSKKAQALWSAAAVRLKASASYL